MSSYFKRSSCSGGISGRRSLLSAGKKTDLSKAVMEMKGSIFRRCSVIFPEMERTEVQRSMREAMRPSSHPTLDKRGDFSLLRTLRMRVAKGREVTM